MSPPIDIIKNRVAEVFPDVEQVDDYVLRFYKQSKAGVPLAVCYLDVGHNLPGTESELHEYIEHTIGSRYFDESRNLQWNNYLFFIRDTQILQDPATEEIKRLIEQDREYARKFVIDENGLDQILRPSLFRQTVDLDQVDVASRWAAVLKQPRLVEAVFGQYTIADRKQLIDGTKPPPEQLAETTQTSELQPDKLLPHLSSIEIREYRSCLQGRKFQFGDVNLLVGANGRGKTSLLEAIELYYCNRTRRNPKIEESYSFAVITNNGTPKMVSDDRSEQVFRDRARSWYGINEPRNQPSKLCDAFGRFSFLNTDAAIDLSKGDDDNIENDLARLVVGSEASTNWQMIERLTANAASSLRRSEQREGEIKQMLSSAEEQLAGTATVKKKSDSLQRALQDALRRNGWTIDNQNLENASASLVIKLSELQSVAQQVTALEWLDLPVTLNACQEFVSAASQTLNVQKSEVRRLQSLEARHAQLESERERNSNTANLLAEFGRLLEAEVERRVEDLNAQRAFVSKTTKLLAGIDEKHIRVAKTIQGNRPVLELQETTTQQRIRLDSLSRDANEASHKFASGRDRSIAMAQQLRNIAAQIIGDLPANKCPLCNTPYTPEELAERMAIGLDEHIETESQKLLTNATQLEKDLHDAENIEHVIKRIAIFCVNVEMPNNTSIKDALTRIEKQMLELSQAQNLVDALNSEEASLRANGLTHERLNIVRSELDTLGHTNSVQSLDELNMLQSSVKEKILDISVEKQSVAEAVYQIRSAVLGAIRLFISNADDIRKGLAELEDRRVQTEAIYSRLILFLPQFNWAQSRPIAEWIIEAKTVENVATELQSALGSERVAQSGYSENLERKQNLEAQLKQVTDQVTKLKEALDLFKELQSNHSLSIVTGSAMEKNRTAIEKIFKQIHSPAEFEGIESNENGWSISRKRSKEMVRLTQISTGQRAAFALSVFLAQNAQIQVGPPVILIDDPIAHIDDLNCLSILDCLRDIALQEKRQIFFATANDKLGSLFQRKFEFLGDRFKLVDLTHNE